MITKATNQPYCRTCGKAIRKWTTPHRVVPIGQMDHPPADAPKTQADAQKLTNEQVVSVRYHTPTSWSVDDGDVPIGLRYVYEFFSWDGETYVDDLFCSNSCAIALGRDVARHHGFAFPAYNRAREKGKK